MEWFSSERWKRLLVVAGGAAATGALAWYLLHHADDDDEESDKDQIGSEDVEYWKVTDAKKANVGVRKGPSTASERIGRSLFSGQAFQVTRVQTAAADDVEGQQYLRLLEGDGWAFTHSARDGRLLCERITLEEYQETVANYTEHQQAMLAANLAWQEQMLQNPELMAQMQEHMMQNPSLMAQMQEQMIHNPALIAQMQEHVLKNPEASQQAANYAADFFHMQSMAQQQAP
mmetsp:Transcript_8378/g.19731  ORF Transcript_8378/g.19731 Transcript_8378/m.19731 type:complete len:231 (-) Transcript_8378:94-786(-)